MLPDLGHLRPWTDPTQLQHGRLPMDALPRRGDEDELVLDGTWVLALHDTPDDVPRDAVTGATPAPDDRWREVSVPGNWTLQLPEDHPHYTNVQMPFPGPPPRLPDRNPTGVYRRSLTVPPEWAGQQIVLHVDGATMWHAAWIDGAFVGYGTDSRLPSAYDVTDRLTPGSTHELAIAVVKFSAHAYLEDQDCWWMAGLHRSVRLEARPLDGIADLRVDADWDPATARGSLRVRTSVRFDGRPRAGLSVRTTLATLDGTRLAEPSTGPVPHLDFEPYVFTGFAVDAAWDDLDVAPWSAEDPALHLVTVELLDAGGAVLDAVSQRAGFRRVEVRDRKLLVNGEAVWIRGVNRHDVHPDRGSAVTVEDMRDDLVAMRRANVNAVRTAHYPNDRAFYDLCDELGFYVVDEANAEAHAHNRSLADDDRWRASWVDRGVRMVQRDRNHPSIILWSLGNEAGYGTAHTAMAGWIRRSDPTRPLHYEDAIRVEGWVDGGREGTDLVCPMYATIDAIRAYGEDGEGDRPLVLCEYSHAMGNSNGSLADYWDVILSTPGLQGGFVWEWKDHGLRQVLPDGTVRLAFGGMYGDEPNDSNFVADGIMSADLEPHPAFAELTWVHRPVAVARDGDALAVTSRRSFVGLDDLAATWELVVDGAVVGRGELAVGDVPPDTTVRVPLPATVRELVDDDAGLAHLVVRCTTRHDDWWARAGAPVAWDEVVLRDGPPAIVAPAGDDVAALHADGTLTAPEPQVWRAATDNDGFKLFELILEDELVGSPAKARWLEQGLRDRPADELVEHVLATDVGGGGRIHRHEIVVPEALADLPRVGVRFTVDARFDRLRWYGRGPHEAYPDRARSAVMGVWEQGIDELPYLVPQEYGLRMDTWWLELLDGATGDVVRVDALDAPLHFSAIRHAAEALFDAAYPDELERSDRLVVSLDAAHRGVGTASCGPDVLDRYRVPAGTYRVAYRLSTRRDG